jgi:tetratricopeptide (TPR) repeat protein
MRHLWQIQLRIGFHTRTFRARTLRSLRHAEVARFRRRDLDGAIELFRAAIAETPSEPRYLLGLGLAEQQKYSDDKSPQNLGAIAEVVTALEPVAVSSAQLVLLANWYDSKRKRDHAAELADRAMKINPSCVGCVDTRARIAFHDGFLDDAVRLERRAIALLPDGANDQPLQKTLGEYEAALKAKPPAPPVASTTPPPSIAN